MELPHILWKPWQWTYFLFVEDPMISYLNLSFVSFHYSAFVFLTSVFNADVLLGRLPHLTLDEISTSGITYKMVYILISDLIHYGVNTDRNEAVFYIIHWSCRNRVQSCQETVSKARRSIRNWNSYLPQKLVDNLFYVYVNV